MRKSPIILLIGALGPGCNSSLASQLKDGDVSVCANEKVQQTAVVSLLPKDLADKALRHGARLRFDSVSATDVKREVGEISCSAIVDVELRGGNRQVPFAYVVRAAANPEEEFIVQSNPPARVNAAIQLGLMEQFLRDDGSEVPLDSENRT